jgi:NAD(P)-dependent dehydrogenase (short-subunit alcohol dehydrogenase family)
VGVRVNTVVPGLTLTERVAEVQDRLAPMIAMNPSRRASTPEIAAAVVFLVSDDASNIHGATLSVDGGRAAV